MQGSGLPFTQTNVQQRGPGPLVPLQRQPLQQGLPFTQTNVQLPGTGPLVPLQRQPLQQGFGLPSVQPQGFGLPTLNQQRIVLPSAQPVLNQSFGQNPYYPPGF